MARRQRVTPDPKLVERIRTLVRCGREWQRGALDYHDLAVVSQRNARLDAAITAAATEGELDQLEEALDYYRRILALPANEYHELRMRLGLASFKGILR